MLAVLQPSGPDFDHPGDIRNPSGINGSRAVAVEAGSSISEDEAAAHPLPNSNIHISGVQDKEQKDEDRKRPVGRDKQDNKLPPGADGIQEGG